MITIETPSTTPTIGDIVHYVFGERHWAAIVTHVHTAEIVNLYVFPDASHTFGWSPSIGKIRFHVEGRHDHTWHWPEAAEPLPTGAVGVDTASEVAADRPSVGMRLRRALRAT